MAREIKIERAHLKDVEEMGYQASLDRVTGTSIWLVGVGRTRNDALLDLARRLHNAAYDADQIASKLFDGILGEGKRPDDYEGFPKAVEETYLPEEGQETDVARMLGDNKYSDEPEIVEKYRAAVGNDEESDKVIKPYMQCLHYCTDGNFPSNQSQHDNQAKADRLFNKMYDFVERRG